MKKLKKLLSLFVIICMTSCLFIVPSYAYSNYCCDISIDSIVQQDGKVTVNWSTDSTEGDRDVTVEIRYEHKKYNTKSSKLIDEYKTKIPSGAYNGTTEFDALNIIAELEYTAIVRYDNNCEQYNCNWRDSQKFVCERGMPVYEVGSEFGEKIHVTNQNIALKATAAESGLYFLGYDSEYPWMIDVFPHTNTYYGGYEFLEKNHATYYVVRLSEDFNDTQECMAEFSFINADPYTIQPSTSTPNDGSTVFSLKDIEDPVILDIPQNGLYEISTVCDSNGDIQILDMNGEHLYDIDFHNTQQMLLDKGSYYLITNSWSYPPKAHTTTIKYKHMATLKFGEEITAPFDTMQYAQFKLDNPASVSADCISGYWEINAASGEDSYYISEYAQILPAGEYVVMYTTHSQNAVCKFNKTDIPITVIGNEISYYTDNYDNNYAILKVPETAQYVFSPSEFFCIDDQEWIYNTSYINLTSGQTMLVKYTGTLSVQKYVPQYSSVNINEDISIGYKLGTKEHYCFTSDKEETYQLLFTNSYGYGVDVSELKIYTDSEVICDETDVYIEKKEVKLAKNEKVYIDLFFSYTYDDYILRIIEKEKPLHISKNTVVDCSNTSLSPEIREIIYTPPEKGYYDFSVINTSSDYSSYISVDINDKYLGEVSYYNIELNSIIYASPDEPLYINITKGASQSTEVELKFSKIDSKAITNMTSFEITDDSYYSFTLPETGIYKITGTAYYEDSSWREAGEYNYYFHPIIKNGHETSVSFDSSEGEAPTFFCGQKGDKILFKEEAMPYYPLVYPIKASISEVTPQQIQPDTLVSTTDDYNIYSVNITKGGTYKFEDFSEELFNPDDGPYGTYYGYGYATFCDGYEWHYDDEYEENRDLVFNLKPGTYYIISATYDYDVQDEHMPCAKFRLSKYFDDSIETEGFSISGEKTSSGINYTISCEEPLPDNAKIYVAVYNELQLIEFKPAETVSLSGNIVLDNTSDSYTYTVFLWDENLIPLCESAQCN